MSSISGEILINYIAIQDHFNFMMKVTINGCTF